MALRSFIKLLLCLLVSVLVWFQFPDTPQLQTGLSLLTLFALLWLSETFHITITALMIPVAAVLSGVFDVKEALVNFAHPVIFLFLGGFALAAAMRKQGLDRRVAGVLLHLARGNGLRSAVYLFIATALLSMWISNTATTAMMLPLALGLLADTDYKEAPRDYWFVLLGVAYSANLGGIGTVLGSPPNAIAAASVGLDFFDWLKLGLPFVMVSFPLMLLSLWLLFRPKLESLSQVRMETSTQLTTQQKLTLLLFLSCVVLWISSTKLAALLGIAGHQDSLIALVAIFAIGALRLAEWKDIQQTADWGVLLLFGGGLTLSAMMKATGASVFIGQLIGVVMATSPLLLALLVVAAMIVLLTEFTSNTASAALLIPVFAGVSASLGWPEEVLAVTIAIGASCAFMMPVATPPNAIVYGSGQVPQSRMMRAGLLLNVLMISLLTAWGWWLISRLA